MTADEYHKMMEVKNHKEKEAAELKEIKKEPREGAEKKKDRKGTREIQ